MGPGKPTVHGCFTGKAVGGPTSSTTDDQRQHDKDKSQDKRAFRKQAQTDTCELTCLRSQFAKPETFGELSNSVTEHVVNKVEVETSRIIKKIAHRKLNQSHRRRSTRRTERTQQNETKHIKIVQNQYTDRVVDVSVAVQRKVSQTQN